MWQIKSFIRRNMMEETGLQVDIYVTDSIEYNAEQAITHGGKKDEENQHNYLQPIP